MGQLLPYFDRPITIDVKGPCCLQGPHIVVAKGGAIACWVETINKTGLIELTFTCEGLAKKIIKIEVK